MKLMELKLTGPFQGHGKGPKEIFTFVLNFVFTICIIIIIIIILIYIYFFFPPPWKSTPKIV